eukprot:scaffold1966_cov109-Cylindrotheca_fusiformis.AAC.4
MSGGEEWCTIESDPGVFTELLGTLGCDTWQRDPASSTPSAKTKACLAEDQIPQGLFFAHQVTTNACATQAILSVVLNQEDNEELGPTLSEFKEFTASFPPSLKGVAISGSDPIRKAHNAFGRQDAFLNDGKYISASRGSDDVFHFVAYIPKGNTVYELDGLQEGPVVVGEYSDEEPWLSVARTAIQERMTGDAIKFNLMAVVKDKRIALKAALEQNPSDETAMLQLQMEEQKRAQWTLENQRRRHNYVPLCVAMLKELARSGKLPELVESAKERKAKKQKKY